MSERRKLPATRPSVVRRVDVAGCKLYIIVSFFEEPEIDVAELFIKVAKQGSTLHGLIDTLATVISVALQYGMPWEAVKKILLHQKFEPSDHQYPSLVHAIAVNVDELLLERRSLWGEDSDKDEET